MANEQHLDILKRSVDGWNEWRQENPSVSPDLAGADLSRADLAVANLSRVDLAGASLIMANLNAADLRGANLTGASLVGCRMLGVDLVSANLSGADLRTAEDLTQEQINETRGDADTNLPEGLGRPKDWGLETERE